jgi:ATP-dependent DNA helicase RecQ
VLHDSAISKYLKNLVVDEAHIVPDWGTFFRPDFQILSIVLNQWRNSSENSIRTYLLSATLSDDVVNTLYRLYGEENHFFEFRCDALRQEPKFCFSAAKTHSEQDEKLIDLVKTLPKPMVIYVLEPDEATRVQKMLKNAGYKNIPTFTGKTKDNDRDLVLRNWKKRKYDIVVATSAFGIGVDKPDVRTIVHKCAPENLSRFYQEVGRSGRDGMPSLSVLIPYVGKTDGQGDLLKAFGLVNKRVLRTKNIIIRWFSMLRSDKGILDGDIATLDTATPPTTFSDQEVEYAGDRNVSWNVNLLLLLHRNKFIDVQEVFYSGQTRSYHFKVKIVRLEDMSNEETIDVALEPIRQKELESQLEGYYLIRNLVREPARQCWGAVFKKLYPLAKECCNGCPYNEDVISSAETCYKIRENPNIPLVENNSPIALKRYSGAYDYFVIRNQGKGTYEIEDAVQATEKMNTIGLSCLVVPEQISACFKFSKIILTHDEYIFLSSLAPFIFAGGTMCIYGFDDMKNDLIFECNEALVKHGYKQVLYCDENMYIKSKNRTLRSFVDCYVKDTNNL